MVDGKKFCARLRPGSPDTPTIRYTMGWCGIMVTRLTMWACRHSLFWPLNFLVPRHSTWLQTPES